MVKWIIGLSISNLFVSNFQVPLGTLDEWIKQAGQLTLSAALVVAVAVLWRALAQKDRLLNQSTKTVTEALAETASANVELRRIIEESVQTKRELAKSINNLSMSVNDLPCTLPERAHRNRGGV